MSGGAGLLKLRHPTVLRKYEYNELMTQHNKVELRKSINIP